MCGTACSVGLCDLISFSNVLVMVFRLWFNLVAVQKSRSILIVKSDRSLVFALKMLKAILLLH